MAQAKKTQIVIEIPESLAKLSKTEADRLKQVFRTEVLNVLSAKAPGALFSITTQNTKHNPPAPLSTAKAGKSGPGGGKKSARGAKKSAKKSNR